MVFWHLRCFRTRKSILTGSPSIPLDLCRDSSECGLLFSWSDYLIIINDKLLRKVLINTQELCVTCAIVQYLFIGVALASWLPGPPGCLSSSGSQVAVNFLIVQSSGTYNEPQYSALRTGRSNLFTAFVLSQSQSMLTRLHLLNGL